ncbi:MAG: hypothetical protein CMH56_08550 [Myxococcales bacterium]|nr:hypothetical protein [Myxococcales bacterium]|tara:strand:- start:1381 stop:2181 length:801 start_codon:yes stop_codon:yes gene_type:complete
MNLQDTHWLITGASAGIGAALAWAAVEHGAKRVVLVARRADKLRQLAQNIQEKFPGVEVIWIEADLLEEMTRNNMVEQVFSGGRIDVWVNNAGMGSNGCFDQLPTSSVLKMVRLNVEALAHLSSLAVQRMKQQPQRSALLQVGSVAGLMPVPTMGLYAATKAFVTSLTDSLSGELSGTSVQVHCLSPAPVKTEFLDVANAEGVLVRQQVPIAQSARSVALSAIRGLKWNITHIYPWLAWPFPLLAWLTPRWVWRVTGKVAARIARQ